MDWGGVGRTGRREQKSCCERAEPGEYRYDECGNEVWRIELELSEGGLIGL